MENLFGAMRGIPKATRGIGQVANQLGDMAKVGHWKKDARTLRRARSEWTASSKQLRALLDYLDEVFEEQGDGSGDLKAMDSKKLHEKSSHAKRISDKINVILGRLASLAKE